MKSLTIGNPIEICDFQDVRNYKILDFNRIPYSKKIVDFQDFWTFFQVSNRPNFLTSEPFLHKIKTIIMSQHTIHVTPVNMKCPWETAREIQFGMYFGSIIFVHLLLAVNTFPEAIHNYLGFLMNPTYLLYLRLSSHVIVGIMRWEEPKITFVRFHVRFTFDPLWMKRDNARYQGSWIQEPPPPYFWLRLYFLLSELSVQEDHSRTPPICCQILKVGFHSRFCDWISHNFRSGQNIHFTRITSLLFEVGSTSYPEWYRFAELAACQFSHMHRSR